MLERHLLIATIQWLAYILAGAACCIGIFVGLRDVSELPGKLLEAPCRRAMPSIEMYLSSVSCRGN
jgi:hypothetical protein